VKTSYDLGDLLLSNDVVQSENAICINMKESAGPRNCKSVLRQEGAVANGELIAAKRRGHVTDGKCLAEDAAERLFGAGVSGKKRQKEHKSGMTTTAYEGSKNRP